VKNLTANKEELRFANRIFETFANTIPKTKTAFESRSFGKTTSGYFPTRKVAGKPAVGEFILLDIAPNASRVSRMRITRSTHCNISARVESQESGAKKGKQDQDSATASNLQPTLVVVSRAAEKQTRQHTSQVWSGIHKGKRSSGHLRKQIFFLLRRLALQPCPEKTHHTRTISCHVMSNLVSSDCVESVLGGRPPRKPPGGRHQMMRRWLPDP
jgi:hypothetical protein